MAGITISRQMGSLGCQVAEKTAEQLGFRLVWRDLINQAARLAGVPEVALATIDELGFLGLKPSIRDRQAYHHAVRQVMQELVEEGGIVIVGRAGQVILHDAPGILHVRIVAPKEFRVTRVMEEKQIPRESALGMVEMSDKNRKLYLQRYYHADVDNPSNYDLVISTGALTPDSAAALICLGLDKLLTKGNFSAVSRSSRI